GARRLRPDLRPSGDAHAELSEGRVTTPLRGPRRDTVAALCVSARDHADPDVLEAWRGIGVERDAVLARRARAVALADRAECRAAARRAADAALDGVSRLAAEAGGAGVGELARRVIGAGLVAGVGREADEAVE